MEFVARNRVLAEQVGFEPTVRHNRTPDFESVALYARIAGGRASARRVLTRTVRRVPELRQIGQEFTRERYNSATPRTVRSEASLPTPTFWRNDGMSKNDSSRHIPKPGKPLNEYQFARTCAMEWLRLNGMAMQEPASAVQIARKLGAQPDKPGNGYAKKAIIEWHRNAISTSTQAPTVLDDDFYNSQAWRRLRYRALSNCNGRCTLCGQPPGKYSLHVDHIKPRSKFPLLALELSNLQVLCRDCNLGKSNTDAIDWRTARREPQDVDGDYSDRAIGRMLRQIA